MTGRRIPDFELNKRSNMVELIRYYEETGEKRTFVLDRLELDMTQYGENVVPPAPKKVKEKRRPKLRI